MKTLLKALPFAFGFLLFMGGICNAQIAFYDALAIRDSIPKGLKTDSSKAAFCAGIIKKYLPQNWKDSNATAIFYGLGQPALIYNPFLYNLFKDIKSELTGVASPWSAPQVESGASSSILPGAIGGLDVTNLADGMAKFLVTRTKQELAAAFFDSFREAVSNPKYKDLQDIFPQTYGTLSAIGDEVYNYDAYIQTLRVSFQRDLDALPSNLPTLIARYWSFFEKHRDLEAALWTACYLGVGLQNNTNPGELLNNYPADSLSSLQSWKGTIQTFQLFSASLRDTAGATDSSSYWISTSRIRQLVTDTITFRIYLGLIYQQACTFDHGDTIKFSSNTSLPEIMKYAGSNFDSVCSAYQNYFLDFSGKIADVTRTISVCKNAKTDSQAVEDYYDFANATIDLFQASMSIGSLVTSSKIRDLDKNDERFFAGIKDTLTELFAIARAGVTLVSDVKSRRYASALTDAMIIYNKTFSDSIVGLISQNSLSLDQAQKDYYSIMGPYNRGGTGTYCCDEKSCR